MASSEQAFVVQSMPGYLIRRLQQIAVGIFMEETKGFDLTPVQFAALEVISARPGLDQIGLSGAVAFDRTTIGGVVERLEAKGLIERRVGVADRRTRELYITAEGEGLLNQLADPVARAQQRILDPLLPEERRLLLEMIGRVLETNNEFSRSPERA